MNTGIKYILIYLCLTSLFTAALQAQEPNPDESQKIEKDSLRKQFLNSLYNGYFPLGKFNIDLRYLVKYNQYEGFRTGLGGETDQSFSDKYKLDGYVVYGFADQRFKYSIGGGVRLEEQHAIWLNLNYTDDLQESGSTTFITDRRYFQFFEPRLFNIDLFHRHITKTLNVEFQAKPEFLTEIQLGSSNINPTYNYTFVNPEKNIELRDFHLSFASLGFGWRPYIVEELNKTSPKSWYTSIQFTQYFKNVLKSNIDFTRLNLKSTFRYTFPNESFIAPTFTASYTFGDTPLTHMFHASPNNIVKERILQRFSVAGIKSFETMYFNEFFSDRLATFQIKYGLKPFKISNRFKPQLVFISRYAIGNMSHSSRHQGLNFNTLDKGYTESTVELNKMLLGFGLSFSYRYGAYYLNNFEDNIALKFTFNITL